MPKISLLAIGNELLDGRTVDTNSNFIASRLANFGLSLEHSLSVADDRSKIVAALSWLSSNSDLIICSGGLGPTNDDLTREAIADYLDSPLQLNLDAEKMVLDFFAARSRTPSPSNLRQAYAPKKALILKNSNGSAPGFIVTQDKLSIAALPGVPIELKTIFDEHLLAWIKSNFPKIQRFNQRIIRVFGLPESVIGERIETLKIDPEISILYRVVLPEIEVTLRQNQGGLSDLLDKHLAKVKASIGEQHIVSDDGRDLVRVVHDLLSAKELTISVAESCTGGLLGSLLTREAGSSKYFLGGIISYSNQVKMQHLGVLESSLTEFGAVSTQVAEEMALGGKKRFCSDYAISITGIAGPGGATETKPVGKFIIGVAGPSSVISREFFYNSWRERIRAYACHCGLDLLRGSIKVA